MLINGLSSATKVLNLVLNSKFLRKKDEGTGYILGNQVACVADLVIVNCFVVTTRITD